MFLSFRLCGGYFPTVITSAVSTAVFTSSSIFSDRFSSDFSILSGNDRLIIWTLLAGGKGGIAGCANVYPHTLASIYDLYKAGRIEEAIKVNESLSPFRALFRLGNPNTIVKKAVQLLGYDVGECRAPFNRLDTSVVEMISSCIESDMKRGLR